MEPSLEIGLDRNRAFASARLALERAHERHIQVRQHRAMNHLTMGPSLMLQATVLPALLCSLLVWAKPWLVGFWNRVILTLGNAFDMPLAMSASNHLTWLSSEPSGGQPAPLTLGITAVVTLLCMLLSYRMGGAMLPLRYLVRILVAVQAVAIAFFWLQPVKYPYDIGNHMNDLMSMGYVLMMAIPVMLAIGYYVLNIGLMTKVMHTTLILFYFAVMVPLQAVAHALILQHFSLLFMPLLYICFGTLFDMLIFIALYSWAASTTPAQATS
jgi:hypothetical protein